MRYLSQLFDATLIVVPVQDGKPDGTSLDGQNVTVLPLSMPGGQGLIRKLTLIPWLIFNAGVLLRAVRSADVIHTPIPGDIGTIGMLLAVIAGKPLFVRHCGNWWVQRTLAERLWRWFMIKFGGGRNIMMATGGAAEPPAKANSTIAWIFSSSLTEAQLDVLAAGPTPAPRQPVRLITVARQEPGKGTDVVIRSLALLENAVLDVVGNGSALDDLQRLVEAKGLRGRVFFHGYQPHARVLELLKKANVFCYPTASEGFPKVVLEAMACGLPVITTAVSVLPFLIGEAGIVLPNSTPEAVAEAVLRCTSHTERYRAMCEMARANVRKYSLERWRDCIGERLRTAWGPLAEEVHDAAA